MDIYVILGRSQSPSPTRAGGATSGAGQGGAVNRVDSPTPATDPDHGKPTTVAGITGNKNDARVKVCPLLYIVIIKGKENII